MAKPTKRHEAEPGKPDVDHRRHSAPLTPVFQFQHRFAPILGGIPADGALAPACGLRVAEQDIALILQQLGVWLTAPAKTSVRQQVLMAHRNLDAHKRIRNALASRPRWLMRRTGIVLEGLPGACPFLEYGRFVADVLEHL